MLNELNHTIVKAGMLTAEELHIATPTIHINLLVQTDRDVCFAIGQNIHAILPSSSSSPCFPDLHFPFLLRRQAKGGLLSSIRLPNEMRKLTNMRHLDLEGCMNTESMPPQIGRLTFLQTLSWFIIGRERRRKLVIRKLENIIEAVDTGQANLKNKPFRMRTKMRSDRDERWPVSSASEREAAERFP
ncbi:hypothetical protein ACLOJK_029447 [Asimina triloba]